MNLFFSGRSYDPVEYAVIPVALTNVIGLFVFLYSIHNSVSVSSSVVRILFESCFGNLTTTKTLLRWSKFSSAIVRWRLKPRESRSSSEIEYGLVVRELWYGRVGNGEIVEDDTVIESLKSDLESVLEIANLLRTKMAAKLVEMLSSRQAVRFSMKVTQFQLKIRLERDTEKQRELSGGGGGGSPIGW